MRPVAIVVVLDAFVFISVTVGQFYQVFEVAALGSLRCNEITHYLIDGKIAVVLSRPVAVRRRWNLGTQLSFLAL